MSPHVEYWGIPSPAEELYCAPETNSPLDDGETALTGGSRFSVQTIESCEGGAGSVPKLSNRSVQFSKQEWQRPNKFMK
jgi:hypothetical protein